jgi:23S rRNA (guanosine2251-2'-O)-methyltransferase
MLAEGITKGSIKEVLYHLHERKVPFQYVPRTKLDRLAEGENHQGVMAQVAATQYASLEDLFARASKQGELPLFIILDGVQDPHNLGSILRVAEATGVHGVIIPKRRAVGLTSVVAKTSAGAIEHIPIVKVTNISQTMDELKERGIWFVGTDGGADQFYHQVDYKLPLAIVMGGEGEGISHNIKKKCDFMVKLPMVGHVSSLNVSTAAAVILYEILRNRS